MPNRNEVDKDLYLALAKHDLGGYTDALMDALDDYIDGDWEPEIVGEAWVDTDISRDMKKDAQ